MNYKQKLNNIVSNTDIIKSNEDSVFLALSHIFQNSQNQIFLHIVKNDARAADIESQLRFFNPDLTILNFPAWDCLPYDRSSPKAEIIAKRIETLAYLSQGTSNKIAIITTINSILQKTIPIENIKQSGFVLRVNDEINIEDLITTLVKNGYNRSPNADNIGEFALRGNIVDIIIQDDEKGEMGYRLDFFGDQIESIRSFDPLTQISAQKVEKISLLPSKEVVLDDKSIDIFKNKYRQLFGISRNIEDDQIYSGVTNKVNVSGIEHFLPLFFEEELSSIFDYLKNYKCQISIENNIENQKQERLAEIKQYYQARLETLRESAADGNIYNPISPELLYLNEQELDEYFSNFLQIRFDYFENQYFKRPIDLEIKQIPEFSLAAKSQGKSSFEVMKDFLQNNLSKKVIISCSSIGSCERLEKILLNYEIDSQISNNINELKELKNNKIALINLPFHLGIYCQDITIISENSILGEKKKTKKAKKIKQGLMGEFLGINIGELIVHRYHGIGRFEGLQNITAGNLTNDFLKISYFGGDNLFLPVEDIDLITRYGNDNPLVQLDKLGSSAWKNRSNKVKKRIKVAAEALIKIAALRKAKKAPIMIPPQGEYEEFKSRFEFVETEDQLNAISEIEEDLSEGSPMDRLICGDVGFGKTEVAMRAAFIAAKNETQHFQVAIVTPTTLLSRQHYHNFLSRFEGTNLKIAQLSRMVSNSKAKEVKEEIENGKINIVIGTHALLNKNIKFKNLGLVIIDEEQHFGVAQKERLKELRNEVHILTLSATPIPRTLQMSLTGVKDLSLITTPPIDRIAIRSFVMDYDSVIIKEAIMREFHRGGKIFFVVPRIKDLEEIHPKLEQLVPEIKIKPAHGQMSPTKLDDIMNEFYEGKFQILLATSIIESGIDIKDANTIIIHKAHMFGLAQLYQLRGRVGRGKIRAYAYLTTPPKRKLTEESTKKLQVMQTLDSLGAGFSIASHDMDIRGSGNILGDEQSGHIKETGIELYQDMLNEAIISLKEGKDYEINEEETIQTQIKLKISLLIPEEYISDLNLRLSFYKRINKIESLEEKEQLATEMIDRFGKLPQEVNNLLEVSYIKYLATKCNIEKMEAKKDGILVTFKNNHFEKGDKLLQMVFSSKNQIKLVQHQILFAFQQNLSDNLGNRNLNFGTEIVNKLLDLLNN